MRLRITYSNAPDDAGFTYTSSTQAKAKGPAAERAQLVNNLREHVNIHWTVQTHNIDGKEVTSRVRKETVVAWLEDENGVKIEDLKIE